MTRITMDHSNLYKCWIDTEPAIVEISRGVQIESRGIDVAMRGPWTRKVAYLQNLYADREIIAWSIPQILLNPVNTTPVTIERDDVIQDESGERYTVVYTDSAVVDSHWYVATVKELTDG